MSDYKMKLDLNILNHLGLSLYSNTPAVLSEVVANSYDADATKVNIITDQENKFIYIIDNGVGMDANDLNNKFLRVGYQKRKSELGGLSKIFNRPVMGRKGIGKLSLLSIAKEIEVHTKTKNGKGIAIKLNLSDIQEQIENQSENSEYKPISIPFDGSEIDESGTKIKISNFTRNIARTPTYLKNRLAKRFVLSKPKGGFEILVNNQIIDHNSIDYNDKLEFIWPIEDQINFKCKNGIIQSKLEGKINDNHVISGWIGTVLKPSDLTEGTESNNKISIICRGKLAQENILQFYNEGGIYANYIIGEIHADFLDDDNEDDIATSNRQEFNQNDVRFKDLQNHVYKLLKKIQSTWTALRNEQSKDKATKQIPKLNTWFESQNTESKKYAKKLFATIESLEFNGDLEKKKELYKYGIISFEKLNARGKLHELNNIELSDLVKFGEIFNDLQDIESAMYYDIAYERVQIIKKLHENTDENVKEKILQQHLFDNLWLLDSSWERATDGTPLIEAKILREFNNISGKELTDEEKNGRFDIKYKTASNKHIIIELKRYKTSYKIDKYDLTRQVEKYKNALQKCLIESGETNPYIESICIVGPSAIDDINDANKTLAVQNSRIIYYDELINNAYKSYETYLENNKKIGKLRSLIDDL